MVKFEDFVWKEHKANNIKENPLEEWYCIVDTGNHARKYGVRPQYPLKDGIYTDFNTEPEYYILFESSGRKATEDDKRQWVYKSVNFDGYIFNDETFIRVFKNREEAEKRAYLGYTHVYGYSLSFIVDDIEQATNKHFVVK